MKSKHHIKTQENLGVQIAQNGAVALTAKSSGKLAGVLEAINPLDAVRDMVTAVTDYKTTKLQEQTKRRQIDAWEAASLESIRAKRDILLKYLDRSFDERRENFQRLFVSLDKALESSRTDQIAPILQGIVLLAQESPFKQLSSLSTVQHFMDDRDTPVEF
jgi:hypothetical protein